MTFPGYFRDHIIVEKLETISLSFLVESMVRLRGGTAPNIAYTLALLGQRPYLFATVGEDFSDYRVWLESKGVDTTYARLIPGVYTASFFANTDLSNAQIASFYPGAMAYAAQLSLKELDREQAGLVVISPNDPEAMKQYVRECQELGYPYIYDPSQQIVRLDADDIRQGVEGCLALFVNDYEFALIRKLTGYTASGILKHARFMVVTRGESGAVIYSQDGEFHIPVVPPEKIADPTGVGDAFRGGFITAYQSRPGLADMRAGWAPWQPRTAWKTPVHKGISTPSRNSSPATDAILMMKASWISSNVRNNNTRDRFGVKHEEL